MRGFRLETGSHSRFDGHLRTVSDEELVEATEITQRRQLIGSYDEFGFSIFLLPRFPPRRTEVLEVSSNTGIELKKSAPVLARKREHFNRSKYIFELLSARAVRADSHAELARHR